MFVIVVVVLFTVSRTTTLVSGTFPQLVTMPLKLIVSPTQLVGGPQVFVTPMQGAVQTVQVAEFVAETVFGINPVAALVSVPDATTVSTNGPHRLTVGV